jgi:hypothetical protein
MNINIDDPGIVENNEVEKHYSVDCFPPNLSDPRTYKANRCLFEAIDSTI